jgi:hypothetical protein
LNAARPPDVLTFNAATQPARYREHASRATP